MTQILITGLTGLVGSAFATETLRRDENAELTAIVRGQGTKNARERVRETIEEQCHLDGCPESVDAFLDRIEVVAGDVADQDIFSVKALNRSFDDVFHCAADVNLGKDPYGHTFRTNYQGTKNMLALALKHAVARFHYVSTAYVSGHYDGVAMEDGLLKNPTFNNAYERSKYFSEKLVREAGVPFSIYRPSIIVGRLSDGAIRKPLAFYRILEFLLKLKKHYCAKRGLDPSHRVHMPLRLQAKPSVNVFFVPIDYLQKTIAALFRLPMLGKTYHLTGNTPVTTKAIERVVGSTLKVDGITVESAVSNPTMDEKLVHKFIEDLLPYFSSQSIFDVANVIAAQGAASLDWGFNEEKLVMLIGGFFRNIYPELGEN